MMKKMMTCLFLALLILMTIALAEGEAESFTHGDYTYTVQDGQVTITAFNSSNKNVEIPAKIDGMPVTAIGPSAFRYDGVKSVVIPKGVTEIGERAFADNPRLASGTFPSTLVSIGDYAFYNTYMTSVTLPSGLKTLGSWSFFASPKLTKLTLPKNLEQIGAGIANKSTVRYCELDSLTAQNLINQTFVDPDYPSYVFVNDAQRQLTLVKYSGYNSTVRIPGGVHVIGEGAFESVGTMQKVIIPDSVHTIGNSAFLSCRGLNSLSIPASVHTIGADAFTGCTSLTSATLPATVKSFGSNMFNGCTNLKTLKLPEGMTEIPSGFCSQCSSLTTVNIPSTVTKIGSWAFDTCDNLKTMTLLDNIQEMGYEVFIATDMTLSCYKGSYVDEWAKGEGVKVEYLVRPRLAGDANADGKVNVMDAVLLFEHAAGAAADMNPENSDVNGDGAVNFADAMLVLQYNAGWGVTLQ